MSQNAGVDFVIGPIYSIGVCDYFTFEVCDYASVQLISIVSDVYENYACAELQSYARMLELYTASIKFFALKMIRPTNFM